MCSPGTAVALLLSRGRLLSFYVHTRVRARPGDDESGGWDRRQQGDVRKTNDPEGAARRITETIAEQQRQFKTGHGRQTVSGRFALRAVPAAYVFDAPAGRATVGKGERLSSFPPARRQNGHRVRSEPVVNISLSTALGKPTGGGSLVLVVRITLLSFRDDLNNDRRMCEQS